MSRVLTAILFSSMHLIGFGQSKDLNLSYLATYDHHNSQKNGFSTGFLFDLPISKSHLLNIEMGLLYSFSEYNGTYNGFPGFPIFDTPTDVTNANRNYGQAVFEQKNILRFSFGINYVQRIKERFSIEYGVCILPSYFTYVKQTYMNFQDTLNYAPTKEQRTYHYSDKGRPSEIGIQPQIKFRLSFKNKLSTFCKISAMILPDNSFLSFGAGLTYQLK